MSRTRHPNPTPWARQRDQLDEGTLDDRAWFARHHGRNYRLRPPIGAAERRLCPPGGQPLVLVHQTAPGARLRNFAALSDQDPLPPNTEAIAEELWLHALAGSRSMTFVDRGVVPPAAEP